MLPLTKTIIYPTTLVYDVGHDLLWSAAINLVAESLIILSVMLLSKKTDKTLFELVENTFGNVGARIVYGLFAVSADFGIPYGNFLLNLLVYSVLPCHTAIIDGGTATLLGGVILYLTHRHRRLQAGAFALFVLAWDILPVLLFMPAGTSASFFFTDAYEWLEVFAVIPMLCYNGTRGHGSKKLFYWFYPTHIYVLYALSFLLYLTLYGMGS